MNSTPLGFLLGVLTAVVAFALVLATQPRATCLRGEVTACTWGPEADGKTCRPTPALQVAR
jgi:hypothetical protein